MIFTNTISLFSQAQLRRTKGFRENCATTHISKPDDARTAPNLLHPPVNHLHPIEKSEDTVSAFSLTLEMKRVKT
ncbi:MAG TPA: hypothetical protein VN948_01020 [Terriglobales bacterium]|nr:hypothetical protein [Terriglobales bacterium]